MHCTQVGRNLYGKDRDHMTTDQIAACARHMYRNLRDGLTRAIRFLRSLGVELEGALKAIFRGAQ